MKLNQECVRKLFLYLEENLEYNGKIVINSITDLKYSLSELIYSAEKLQEAGYIDLIETDPCGEELPLALVTNITYSGHCFLDTIRDNAVWQKTKSITSKFASVSLNLLSDIASKVILQMITFPTS